MTPVDCSMDLRMVRIGQNWFLLALWREMRVQNFGALCLACNLEQAVVAVTTPAYLPLIHLLSSNQR